MTDEGRKTEDEATPDGPVEISEEDLDPASGGAASTELQGTATEARKVVTANITLAKMIDRD